MSTSGQRNSILAKGLMAHEAGDFSTARAVYSQILGTDPLDAEAHFFLGLALLQTGQAFDAEKSLARRVILGPADAGVWNYLGIARLDLDCAAAAVEAFVVAVNCDPKNDDTHYNAGVALNRQRSFQRAADFLWKAAILNPVSWKIWNNLGSSRRGTNLLLDSKVAYLRANLLAPDEGGPAFNLGVLLQDQGHWADALSAYVSSTNSFRRDATGLVFISDVFRNRGIVLTTMGRSLEGREWLERAIVMTPGSLSVWNNYGNALKESRAVQNASTAYERALAIDHEHPETLWNKALLLLLTGEIAVGFALYEHRWRVRELFPTTREFSIPRYSGTETLSDRHVFLFAEQGLGDTLQFARFSRQLMKRGAWVTLEVPSQLVPLLRRAEIASDVIARGDPVPAADMQSPLMSLPAAWSLDARSLGVEVPYLHADIVRVEKWSEIIMREPGMMNIGVCWRGGAGFRGDAMRSFGPEAFAGLAARSDLMLFSLQQATAEDQGILGDLGIAWFDEDYDSDGAFLDSLAILEHLDLVITVDTAIAHLAAAAGKPTWIVLSYVPDWRWMLDRDDSPWYPTVRLFRQPAPGDWAGAFAAVERAIDRVTRTESL